MSEKMVQLNEEIIKGQIKELVCGSVEEILNELLEKEAAKKVEDSIEEALTYCDFLSEHGTRIRTKNVIERLNREIRRRTQMVGTFPVSLNWQIYPCSLSFGRLCLGRFLKMYGNEAQKRTRVLKTHACVFAILSCDTWLPHLSHPKTVARCLLASVGFYMPGRVSHVEAPPRLSV